MKNLNQKANSHVIVIIYKVLISHLIQIKEHQYNYLTIMNDLMITYLFEVKMNL